LVYRVTPERLWKTNTSTRVLDAILRSWLEDNDQVDELLQVDSIRAADLERLSGTGLRCLTHRAASWSGSRNAIPAKGATGRSWSVSPLRGNRHIRGRQPGGRAACGYSHSAISVDRL
jgi:hypothetical protein